MELKRVFANSIFQAIAKLFTACASFLITIVIAHTYGSYEYGLFTKVVTVVGFSYLLIDFGYNAMFLQDDYFKKRLGSFIVFRTLLGAVLTGLLFGILSIPFLAGSIGFFGNTRWYAIIFSGTIISYGLTLCASAVFQKEFRYDLLARSTQEVGAYGLAYRFFEFLIAVPLFLSNSLYPLFLRHGKNSQTLQSLIKKYGFVFLGISLVLVVFSWILAPLLSRVNEGFDLWYGLLASSVITGVSELLVFVGMIPIFLRLKIFHENA